MKGTLKFKGETRTVDIPTRWEEVSFRYFVLLHKAGVFKENAKIDWLKVFSIFTELTEEELVSATWVELDNLLVALTFLYSEMPNTLPQTILGYKIPEDIGFETVGQYKYIKDDVEATATLDPVQQLERYTVYVAAYACAQKHGEFSWAKCEEMADEFLEAPAVEVLATANFILLKLIGLSQPIGNGFRKRNTLRRRLKQVTRAWRFYLASEVRLWLWRRKQDSQPTS